MAFHHIANDCISNGGDPAGWFAALTKFFPWDAGVDIFFVISGFVIVHASAKLFAARSGPKMFLRRRLQRIIPLYWLMTTLFLAVLIAARSAINGDIGGPAYILASYLFIPWPRPDGVLQPAFGLGWTLNYEMFFYAVFTPFLLLPRKPAVIGATLLLAGFAACGAVIGFPSPQLAFWSNPIILEFCAGMMLALLPPGPRLNLPLRLALAALALVLLHFAIAAPPAWRAAVYGAPAVLLVAAATLGAPAAMSAGEKLLARLGDASYAMYLAHPFVMRAFTVLWHKFHAHNELAGTIYVLVGLTVAQACALAVNVTVERKFALLLRGGRGLKNEAV